MHDTFSQVPKADIPMSDLQERFKQIAGFHFVSSIEGKVSAHGVCFEQTSGQQFSRFQG